MVKLRTPRPPAPIGSEDEEIKHRDDASATVRGDGQPSVDHLVVEEGRWRNVRAPRQGQGWWLNDEQSIRIASAFARQAVSSPGTPLCSACIDLLEVTGVGITIMSGEHSGPVCSSNERSAGLEDLQFALGEGPCQDAFAAGAPVLTPQLDDLAWARWPTFVGQAVEAGIGAVFAFPLASGSATVGVLTIYEDDAGELSDAQCRDTVAVATVLAHTLLTMQPSAADDVLPESLDSAFVHRAEVHQASGMVAVQLGVPVTEALVRIRGHAYAAGRDLAAVAADVVGRHLRLVDDRHLDEEG
jgi:hypothetical protein